jgi:hypothetical protein
LAVLGGHTSIVPLLLAKGANMNARTKNGDTALKICQGKETDRHGGPTAKGWSEGIDEAARLLDITLCERLAESSTFNVEERLTRRYQKLRQLGKWGTSIS